MYLSTDRFSYFLRILLCAGRFWVSASGQLLCSSQPIAAQGVKSGLYITVSLSSLYKELQAAFVVMATVVTTGLKVSHQRSPL